MNDLQPKLRVIVCRTPLAAELSREAVIRSLAAEIAQGDAAYAEAVVTSALAREAEESTYVGRGLAVPHARLAGAVQPCICLATSPGVDWQGEQATLIALPAVPETQPEWHLLLLSTLARYVSAHRSGIDLDALAAALQQKTA